MLNDEARRLQLVSIQILQLAIDTASRYLDYLPDPILEIKTDADGKFTISKLPKGDFFIVATAKRLVGDETEHYVWKIPASQIRGKDQLFLSNDNLGWK